MGTTVKRPLSVLVLLGFAFLVTQSFQCASSGVASARKAIQNEDYAKAKTALEQALATNPNNCEALIMLGDVNQRLNDVDGMLDAYAKAKTCPDLTQTQREELSIKLYNSWVGSYNGGISNFNKYVSSRADSDLVESVMMLKTATELKPTFTEPYSILGQAQEARGDTSAAIETYQRWLTMEQPGFDLMISKGVTLGSARSVALDRLGVPKESRIDSSYTDGTLVMQDKIDVGGRDVYVFSATSSISKDTVLEGWTYNPPADLSTPEKWRSHTTSLGPLKSLAFVLYERDNKEEALTMATFASKLKPSDGELGPLRTQLLQDLGKTDEALAEVKALLKDDPQNANFRLQYAALLSNTGNNDQAIAEYITVLETDPNNGTALYNAAASFKNRASESQMAELKKMDADDSYMPNTGYTDDLKTAAKYFEQLRKQPKYAADIIVLEQLANTYEVLKEKKNVKMLIMELEGLEGRYQDSAEYFRIMEGLYARNNMMDKMKTAADKGAKLR